MINLTHLCIITDNVFELTNFYEDILEMKAERYGENYSEIEVSNTFISIFNFEDMENLSPGSSDIMANQSVIFEFEVDDIEAEYERIKNCNVEIVKGITTQAWGNTSFYFRDPDGNLINFYQKES